MKKPLIVAAMIAAAGAAVFGATSIVSAQQSTQMTDAHMQRIQQNCGEALSTIQRLHTNDGPLRVNRGQSYDSISTKLMSRMNSRLALNKLDGSSLVKITAKYDQELAAFRTNYKKYDDQMSNILQIDCRRQPVSFYDAVNKARELREQVHQNTVILNKYIIEYETEFIAIKDQLVQKAGEASE